MNNQTIDLFQEVTVRGDVEVRASPLAIRGTGTGAADRPFSICASPAKAAQLSGWYVLLERAATRDTPK